jgi:nitrate/nitrite transporter NarK
MAIGIFGMGMGGTAISALTTVKLTAHLGIHAPFIIVAAVLAAYGVAAAFVLRDAPDRKISAEPALARVADTLRLRVTWQASALYAVGFGGFVAFSVYLPVYLKNAYLLSRQRGHQDGRIRAARGDHAASRRLAVRPLLWLPCSPSPSPSSRQARSASR